MDIENLEESLRRIEIDCGLPEGFCFGLLHEQSWSFVIKLHAILEAAVSQLLVNVFDRKELSKVFAELQMSNFKTGKLAFVRSLNLLPKSYIVFIQALSQLRNDLVHEVKNVSFDLGSDFQEQLLKLTPSDARKLADKWAFAYRDTERSVASEIRFPGSAIVESGEGFEPGQPLSRSQAFYLHPQGEMLCSAMGILDTISMRNRYGAHIWNFLRIEDEDQAHFLKRAEEVFSKAKVGDPELAFKTKATLERRNPNLKVILDDDGQPVLESLAAALYQDCLRETAELD